MTEHNIKDQFYIWSFEHKAWWRSLSLGYTTDLQYAGKYAYAEAVKICVGANCYEQVDEAMVPVTMSELDLA